LKIKELKTLPEMLGQLDIIQQLYPNMSKEKYQEFLFGMIPKNYSQVAVFENDVCVGLTGMWFGIKLWSGRYLEIDNFIVHTDHRSKGIGTLITNYIDGKAKALDCTMIVLDVYTNNYKAQRFYFNQGYAPKGFHFVKILNENGLS
jgi:ribosomal protein S18 acetylase RimI-like enzyme